jgi:hypothetical protein
MVDTQNMPSSGIPPIVSLHKYFIRANQMRAHFDTILTQIQRNKVSETEPGNQRDIECELYMSFWYAGVYVLIEGWRELHLTDRRIEELLNQDNYVELLRRYRNGIFHFQKEYYDQRLANVWMEKEDFVQWIRTLNKEFGRFFLEWFKDYKDKNP